MGRISQRTLFFCRFPVAEKSTFPTGGGRETLAGLMFAAVLLSENFNPVNLNTSRRVLQRQHFILQLLNHIDRKALKERFPRLASLIRCCWSHVKQPIRQMMVELNPENSNVHANVSRWICWHVRRLGVCVCVFFPAERAILACQLGPACTLTCVCVCVGGGGGQGSIQAQTQSPSTRPIAANSNTARKRKNND